MSFIDRRRSTLFLSILFLALLAGFFRFNHLRTLPLGLYHDEGMNGNDAIHAIRTGEWKIFYPANSGREGLFINLQAVSIMLFGATPWALRAVSAMMGVLTVLGLYLLVRDLYGQRHALIAGVLQSVLIWPVIVSRFGLRVNMAAALLVWMLWAMLRAYELKQSFPQRRTLFAILAGIFLGLGFHSYISFRIVPLLVVAIIVIARKRKVSELWVISGWVVGIATLIASPLLIYFIMHPADLFSRSQTVSIFATDHPLRTFVGNLAKEAAMCFYRGDLNWRHNYSGAPMMYWPAAIFLVVGMVCLVISLSSKRTLGKWREQFLLAWLVIGSLPGLLSAEAFPHGLRLLIVAPALVAVASVGFTNAEEFLRGRLRKYGRGISTVLTATVLLMITLHESNRYFGDYANNQGMKAAFAYPQYELAQSFQLSLPIGRSRYIIAHDTTLAYGIPLDAQGFAFFTHTLTPEAQDRQNIHYVSQFHFIRNDSVEYFELPVVSERGY